MSDHTIDIGVILNKFKINKKLAAFSADLKEIICEGNSVLEINNTLNTMGYSEKVVYVRTDRKVKKELNFF